MKSRSGITLLVGVLLLCTGSSCARRTSSLSPPGTPPPPTAAPGRTTIAPFPVPGDTSAEDSVRRKMLNLPKPGDYVYVDELPEAIQRVAPEYPAEARRAGIQGTVMVQARVLPDGSVGETLLVSSIPALDAAAVACVKQWRFKPGAAEGRPVAVWVGIPVKFVLP